MSGVAAPDPVRLPAVSRRGLALGAAWAAPTIVAAGAAPALAASPSVRPPQLDRSRAFIDGLTINSTRNVPSVVVPTASYWFSWDNEKKTSALIEWNYYNGVVFEGISNLYEVTGLAVYRTYENAYLDALVTSGALNGYAAFVNTSLDSFKPATLLLDFADAEYAQVAATLYQTLANDNAKYTLAAVGYNYWHKWSPYSLYTVWLDGLYMGQPFLAEYAHKIGDTAQLARVASRFTWVHDNLRNAATGLYYHAGYQPTNPAAVVPYHWLRAIGWFAMAQVDVLEYVTSADRTALAARFQTFVDGMLPYQDATTGMWCNLINVAPSSTNRLETSGTSMMVYAILKAVRLGWLPDPAGSYRAAALKAFLGMVDSKLVRTTSLTDIYFKASGDGNNNYQNAAYYYTNEGKGVGPFIKAYAEALRLYG